MNTFPLMRTRWSNEKVMAALFLVLILYHIPQWIENPISILSFILLVVVGLSLDAVANLLRYHRLWCSVSAAITSAMISLLTAGVPLWGKLIGIVVALLLGKHIWGGTGKNIVNPAMIGLLAVLMLFDLPYPFFPATYLLIPAVILSIPFLAMRPSASIGFILGMAAVLSVRQNLNMESLITVGAFFWGCIALTDPVTVTKRQLTGFTMSYLSGFAALFLHPGAFSFVVSILVVNLLSGLLENAGSKSRHELKPKFRIPKQFPYNDKLIDLTGDKELISEDVWDASDEMLVSKESVATDLETELILERIKANEVFGMGGAAFSAYQKIMAVLLAKGEKHLIINGVECDPGLIHDYWLLRNEAREIQKGIDLLCRCISFFSIHLAVKEMDGLKYSDNLELHQVADYYPMGAEKLLISEVLGKKLTSDQLPATCGILVLNVQTVYAISQAVHLNHKVDTRYLTVANRKNKSAQVVKVQLGRKVQEIMDAVYPGTVNIFVGGGLMQSYPADDEAVVDKRVNFIATGGFPEYKESPQCSKCGICTRNCPAGLQVNRIADLVDQSKLKETSEYHADQCIGCGSCSYSCLAGRNLAIKVKVAKEALAVS